MRNKLIDFYNTLNDKQRKRLMVHVDNIVAKEKSPRKEKKKPKKTQILKKIPSLQIPKNIL